MAKLIVIEGPDRGTEFPLGEEPRAANTIGRDPKNPIVLNDASVSRQHLRIEFTGRDFRLVDLGSRNRTFLNGEPIREGLLRNGDRIGIGDSELRFEEDRASVEEQGLESTIMKELPAGGDAGLSAILESLAGRRDEKLHDALGRVRKLIEISQAITRSASIDELHNEMLGILVSALEADRAVVLVPEGGRWTPRASRKGAEAAGREEGPISESIVRRAAEEGKAILSAHTRRDERFQDKASVVQSGIVSAIAAPISAVPPGERGEKPGAAAKVIAVLYADRRGAERPFGDA